MATARAPEIKLEDLVEVSYSAVIKARERHFDPKNPWISGPILVGLIWWPDGGQPIIPNLPGMPQDEGGKG